MMRVPGRKPLSLRGLSMFSVQTPATAAGPNVTNITISVTVVDICNLNENNQPKTNGSKTVRGPVAGNEIIHTNALEMQMYDSNRKTVAGAFVFTHS